MYILDSPWLASLIYFHSSENGTLHGPCSQPETLLALRAAVVHCLPLEASFPHPAKSATAPEFNGRLDTTAGVNQAI